MKEIIGSPVDMNSLRNNTSVVRKNILKLSGLDFRKILAGAEFYMDDGYRVNMCVDKKTGEIVEIGRNFFLYNGESLQINISLNVRFDDKKTSIVLVDSDELSPQAQKALKESLLEYQKK